MSRHTGAHISPGVTIGVLLAVGALCATCTSGPGSSSDDGFDAAAHLDAGQDGMAGTSDASEAVDVERDQRPPTDTATRDTSGESGDTGGASDTAPDSGPPDGSTTVVSGRLKLTTSVPPRVDECEPTGETPCDDLDGDGLVDAWETLVLERFRPALVFDEDEQFLSDPDAVVAHVGRVAPTRHPQRIVVYLTILYSRDYGTCGSLTSHDGDSERVALYLWLEDDGPIVLRAYTAAHENTPTDHSMRFSTDELGQLEYDETVPDEARWVVYPSRDKHATYITRDVCESISPLPCFSEACGPDGEARSAFTILADVRNAGEPDAPMLEDLSAVGFPGEQAWVDQKFCGGRSRSGTCSGSVFGKLTNDPFQ